MTSQSGAISEPEFPVMAARRDRSHGWRVVFVGLFFAGAAWLASASQPHVRGMIDQVLAAASMGSSSTEGAAALPSEDTQGIAALNVDDRAQILDEGASAQARNAAIPLSGEPVELARGFVLAGLAAPSAPTALKCLTQAVYYEAAFEPLTGRRAVAQVVLNRMRHPAYPKSVCGVVYQGSHLRTGCQFSFTCDGALLRAPAARAWREAEAVARAALSGYVEPSVGTATHYHADYVLPKWAFNLAKIEQVGRHIFYRFHGRLGRAEAFTGRYAGLEAIPDLDMAALQMRLADGEALDAANALTPGLSVPPHVSDRHAANDVGGRLDVSKGWRLTIPDPVEASRHYRDALGEEPANAVTATVAAADPVAAIPTQAGIAVKP